MEQQKLFPPQKTRNSLSTLNQPWTELRDRLLSVLIASIAMVGLAHANPNQFAELRVIHTAAELYQRACDVRNNASLQCAFAAHQYCLSKGYEGGDGPFEYFGNTAVVACFGEGAAAYREFPYSGLCTHSKPGSLFCTHLALTECVKAEYVGASGVISANSYAIGTMCLKAATGATGVAFSNLSVLANQNLELQSCTYSGVVDGWGCQNQAHRFCVAQGYGTGFNVSYDGNSGSGSVICANAEWAESEIHFDQGISVRSAQVGTQILGGLANNMAGDGAGWLTPGDALRNDGDKPLLITYATIGSTYSGFPNSDSCFYLNAGVTKQEPNRDGEIACVYSAASERPNLDFGRYGRGILLDVNQTLIFGATPVWGGGGFNEYVTARVTVVDAESTGYIGMRRERFPRIDSVYNAGLVSAGCAAVCSIAPIRTNPPTVPALSNNEIYHVVKPTTVRGISIFANSPVSATLRVTDKYGAELRPPFSFHIDRTYVPSLHAYKMTPSSFNQAFGDAQTGSAFVPLDIELPADASIGVDYYVHGDNADFAGYVWLDQDKPAIMAKNLTSQEIVFYDDFSRATSISHGIAPDFSGDFDPVANVGSWSVYEYPYETSGAMIQITNTPASTVSGGARRSKYIRIYRDGNAAAGLNAQDVNGVFSAMQSTTGDVIRLSMMVLVPPDGRNARGQFFLVGSPGNVQTARAWVRPDGNGNVVAVGPGYALTDTNIRYTPGVWQRWDLTYEVGSSTFTVSVAGSTSGPLTSYSTGSVAAFELFNGNGSAGEIDVAGVDD